MISYSFWQYHIHFSLSCAIFSWYCLWYHIHIIQYLLWYQYIMILRMTSEHISHDKVLWYQYIMISKPCDITDFMICSPISCHLRGGMGRVGGASFQPLHLLRPRHRPRAGDGCPAERRRTWSRAWTCCSGCCASSEWRPIDSRWKKSARRGRCCRQCSPCRHSADAPRQMTLVRIVIGWTRSSSWIQVGNWWEVEGGGSERPRRQPEQFESGVTDYGVARRACKRAEAAPPPIYRSLRHCTRANNCETTPYGTIAKIFNLIQY